MLGQFLEFSLAARPIAPTAAFFAAIGFRSIATSDALPHPYAAFFDGRITVGVHDREAPSPALTFVRPDLKNYVRALRRLRIPLDERHLADDEFNSVAFSDPNGQTVVLLEARTFPPGAWDTQNVAACGAFLEYSIATDDLDAALEFWQELGFKRTADAAAPHRWVRLGGHGLVIGLHAAHFRPGLSFAAPQLAARLEYLKAKGFAARGTAPTLADGRRTAALETPDGAAFYLLDV